MTLIGLLMALLILAVVIWGARALIRAFDVPDPIATVIYVIVVLIAVLWFVGELGVHPLGRLR